MFLHQLDLTTALRPSLLPEETLLFVQDAVGLYEGYVPAACLAARAMQLTPHAQQIQDPTVPERPGISDLTSSLLCRPCRTAQELGCHLPQRCREAGLLCRSGRSRCDVEHAITGVDVQRRLAFSSLRPRSPSSLNPRTNSHGGSMRPLRRVPRLAPRSAETVLHHLHRSVHPGCAQSAPSRTQYRPTLILR
jgi:hypothetical protein